MTTTIWICIVVYMLCFIFGAVWADDKANTYLFNGYDDPPAPPLFLVVGGIIGPLIVIAELIRLLVQHVLRPRFPIVDRFVRWLDL